MDLSHIEKASERLRFDEGYVDSLELIVSSSVVQHNARDTVRTDLDDIEARAAAEYGPFYGTPRLIGRVAAIKATSQL